MSIIVRIFIVENQRVTLNYVKTENHHNTLPERSKVPGTITFVRKDGTDELHRQDKPYNSGKDIERG